MSFRNVGRWISLPLERGRLTVSSLCAFHLLAFTGQIWERYQASPQTPSKKANAYFPKCHFLQHFYSGRLFECKYKNYRWFTPWLNCFICLIFVLWHGFSEKNAHKYDALYTWLMTSAHERSIVVTTKHEKLGNPHIWIKTKSNQFWHLPAFYLFFIKVCKVGDLGALFFCLNTIIQWS